MRCTLRCSRALSWTTTVYIHPSSMRARSRPRQKYQVSFFTIRWTGSSERWGKRVEREGVACWLYKTDNSDYNIAIRGVRLCRSQLLVETLLLEREEGRGKRDMWTERAKWERWRGEWAETWVVRRETRPTGDEWQTQKPQYKNKRVLKGRGDTCTISAVSDEGGVCVCVTTFNKWTYHQMHDPQGSQ